MTRSHPPKLGATSWGLCVGAEKTWGANRDRVLLAQQGMVGVSWLGGVTLPMGPQFGHVLAFPQYPEAGDGTTWDEHL